MSETLIMDRYRGRPDALKKVKENYRAWERLHGMSAAPSPYSVPVTSSPDSAPGSSHEHQDDADEQEYEPDRIEGWDRYDEPDEDEDDA